MVKRLQIGAEKQNIRVWYNYLQLALDLKLDINKEYYKKWHLSKVKNMRFDSWYKDHKDLFVERKNITIRISTKLSYKDAVEKAKELLKGKTDKSSEYNLSTKRFRYLEIDDYLKCYKQKLNTNKTLYEIGFDIWSDYQKKQSKSKQSKKLLVRKFMRKSDVSKYGDKFDRVFGIMISRKISKAKSIVENTAKGQFPGKY